MVANFDTREQIKRRMDELARQFAETHDEAIKREIEQISLRLAEIRNPH